MIDLLLTQAKAPEVFKGVDVVTPSECYGLLWPVLIDIGNDAYAAVPASVNPYQRVGAYARSRQAALSRAFGEAVERVALRPPHATQSVYEAQVHRLSDSFPKFEIMGRRQIPAAQVDYPSTSRGQDSTPSGAAAGPSFAFARSRAVLELLERDAIMRMWYSGDVFCVQSATDSLVELSSLRERSNRMSLAAFVGECRLLGWQIDMLTSPTKHPDITATLCILTTDTGGVSFGSRASNDLLSSAAGALCEAVQMRSAIDHSPFEDHVDPSEPVVDDLSRLRHWMHPKIHQKFLQIRSSRSGERPRKMEMVLIDGIDDLVDLEVSIVDLTHRLPDPLQRIGWRVCKAISYDLQPIFVTEPVGRSTADLDIQPLPHPLA